MSQDLLRSGWGASWSNVAEPLLLLVTVAFVGGGVLPVAAAPPQQGQLQLATLHLPQRWASAWGGGGRKAREEPATMTPLLRVQEETGSSHLEEGSSLRPAPPPSVIGGLLTSGDVSCGSTDSWSDSEKVQLLRKPKCLKVKLDECSSQPEKKLEKPPVLLLVPEAELQPGECRL